MAAEGVVVLNSHNINDQKGVLKAISLMAMEMIAIQCVFDRKTWIRLSYSWE